MISVLVSFFFFNVPATPEIYTLSLHDALPIWAVLLLALRAAAVGRAAPGDQLQPGRPRRPLRTGRPLRPNWDRSEEHTSELQSRRDLVCRLLLEKKKKTKLACNFQASEFKDGP